MRFTDFNNYGLPKMPKYLQSPVEELEDNYLLWFLKNMPPSHEFFGIIEQEAKERGLIDENGYPIEENGNLHDY